MSSKALKLLTASEFSQEWGTDSLICLASSHSANSLPSEARDFLTQAGLPALITFHNSTLVKSTFCRLKDDLCRITDEAPFLPSEWRDYWIIGDLFFCQGQAAWCVHEKSGHVFCIDLDVTDKIQFVNTSLRHFMSAFHAALKWSEGYSRSTETWKSDVSGFKQSLESLDPVGMDSITNFWPSYLRNLSDEGPYVQTSKLVFLGELKRGSKEEGVSARKAGKW